MRVIGVGLNKTGTKTLGIALGQLGLTRRLSFDAAAFRLWRAGQHALWSPESLAERIRKLWRVHERAASRCRAQGGGSRDEVGGGSTGVASVGAGGALRAG